MSLRDSLIRNNGDDPLEIPAFLRRPHDAAANSSEAKPASESSAKPASCEAANQDYLAFLEAKKKIAPVLGFEIDPAEINPALKDFVRLAIVPWAARGGRRAIFSSFGLHKTSVQLELARLASRKIAGLPLIVVPLGVRHEFFDEAALRFTGDYAVNLKFIRCTDDIDDADLSDGSDEWRRPTVPSIYLTNYESVREGKIDLGLFDFASLDEAAVLRGFGGTKTFREFMRVFESVRYRFVATATPDPNEYIELLAYAAYLGIMDVGEAKTRFFKRDSTQADKLTIHAHKEKEFWLWVASWALFVRRPSDLCRCSCQPGNNCSVAASANSSSSGGAKVPSATERGNAAATAATPSLSHRAASNAASLSVADASDQSTAAKERASMPFGEASSIDARGLSTRTGLTTEDVASPSASAGSISETSETTWASPQRTKQSIASTTTETTSPEIVDGQAGSNKPGTDALAEKRPSLDVNAKCDHCPWDEGYDLPPLDIRWHEVPSDHSTAGEDRDGQVRMFRNAAIGIGDAAREKRDSLPARIAKLQELRAEDPGAHRILWHDLEAEREALEDALPIRSYEMWEEYRDGNSRARALYERHYSARPDRDSKLIVGPGEKMVLLTPKTNALFVWRKFIDDSGQTGVNCAVFRNEGMSQSSALITEAMAIAWQRWPGERLYTYVDADAVASTNPGFCFQAAGWRKCGETKSGLVILEATPEISIPPLASRENLRSIFGAQELELNERNAVDFKYGRFAELATKPVMSGAGCNFQMHCAWAVFLGIGHKFHDFIQAVHRLARFGQTRTVRLDLIYTEAEREIRKNLEAKWKRHEAQAERMAQIIREYGLAETALASALQRSIGVTRREAAGEAWRAIHNDSVAETRTMASDSVDLIVTSIPFATQYEYTPSYNDFGHTDDNDHFWRQMDFLTPELFRIARPGRVVAIHVKDRIVPSGMAGPDGRAMGFQTVQPFHAEAIQHYRRHGFGFLGMKTVVTDVVRENNQTYRLGWSEQCKDGTRMGAGLPEYVLLFRKPPSDRSNGYADQPVVKEKPLCDDHGVAAPFDKVSNWKQPIAGTGYSRARWQMDAHGFTRSSGDRLVSSAELQALIGGAVKREDLHKHLYRLWRERSSGQVYDFAGHVSTAEELDRAGLLPATFMLLPPHSWHPDVWTDVTRMRTLNGAQHAAGREMHLCPLQLDLVERLITQFSMPGEVVFDPFMGIGTVPSLAVEMGRRGLGVELSELYWKDAVIYCQAAETKISTPTLFDLLDAAPPQDGASPGDSARAFAGAASDDDLTTGEAAE